MGNPYFVALGEAQDCIADEKVEAAMQNLTFKIRYLVSEYIVGTQM